MPHGTWAMSGKASSCHGVGIVSSMRRTGLPRNIQVKEIFLLHILYILSLIKKINHFLQNIIIMSFTYDTNL